MHARREMAQLMRRFARGGLTVEEFESVSEGLADRDRTADHARMFAWNFYSDYFAGDFQKTLKLTPEARRLWAKWVLFLMAGDEEYTGPSLAPSLTALWIRLAVLGLCWRFGQWWTAIVALLYLFALEGRLLDAMHKATLRLKKPLPRHWPFGSAESFQRAVSRRNPFAVDTPV